MDLQLGGKVAVITGGSMGIGLAVGRALAGEGVHVVLCGRDGERADGHARSIEGAYGVRTLGLSADVTQPADIDSLVAEVDRVFGGAGAASSFITPPSVPNNPSTTSPSTTSPRRRWLCSPSVWPPTSSATISASTASIRV